jgi:hypothetical protein
MLNDIATNYNLTPWEQTIVSETQNFHTLYDATVVNGLKDIMNVPSSVLATLTHNSLNDDGPLGVYSKSWLKFTQNELYLPEEVITHTTANKTDHRSKREPRTLDNTWVFDIYPNPANEYITIALNTYEIKERLHIEIMNSTGKLVLEDFHHSNGIINMNTENLPSGMYVIRISDGVEVIQNKVIEIIN